ncbi:MAG: VWA domain-containing protein [Deltaproteobacteria bacterium]|nr:VWA domain-containing protein [Deltaproteobacteria bacterium]
MKKISILFGFLLISVFCFYSCKKPESKKNPVQQTIETPVMQMAEAPTQPPATLEKEQKAETEKNPEIKSEASAVPATLNIIKTSVNTEIIIDASGSMNGPVGQTTKIEAIKSALKDILSTPLPPEITNRKIAVRTFGSQHPSEENNCSDTVLNLKMDKNSTETILSSLGQITPQGTAPLAFTLENSYNDFTESGETVDNLIILITDGKESCNGDPKAAVERLHRSKASVIVDVIGFDVDQETQTELKELAKAGDGTFYLARSDVELATTLDQAISSNLPYNLRVRAASGASPLPSLITVYRANTQSVVERTESPGIKFFKLASGSYDILVEYRGSIESTKPSKIIKGVEVTATAKAEQIVQFDLGNVNLTALDQNGKETLANFYFRKSESDQIIGRLMGTTSPQTVHLSPGVYDVDAETAESDAPLLTASVKGIEVKASETIEQTLKFQTGKLALKGQNVGKQPIPISYKVTKPGTTEAIASGEGPLEGITLDLAPGTYDVYVAWKDPNIQGSPETMLPNLTVNGGEMLEQLATIVAGSIKLSGKDSSNKFAHTEFSIKKAGGTEEIVKAVSESTPVEVFVAPGNYDIVATDTTSKVIPPPSVAWDSITVKEGAAQSLEAVFKLGAVKLIGKNAKEQTIPATFTVYRAGTDEPLVVEQSERDWVLFNLTPTIYDIKAEDSKARSEPKPTIWFHDIEIKEGQTLTSEAIFTSGKLKLICRGKNNAILACEFNVFSYGSDTALFSGETADEWKEFDIPPGKYYMEAGWHDPKEEQFVKKWINIEVGENQIVEQTLRF